MIIASKKNLAAAIMLSILIFFLGYWISAYFFNWFLLGSNQLFFVEDILAEQPRQRVFFGLAFTLFTNLVFATCLKHSLTKGTKVWIALLFFTFMLLSALVSKIFINSFATEIYGETGSGMFIDSYSFTKGIETVTIGMGTGLITIYILVNVFLKQTRGNK